MSQAFSLLFAQFCNKYMKERLDQDSLLNSVSRTSPSQNALVTEEVPVETYNSHIIQSSTLHKNINITDKFMSVIPCKKSCFI